VLIDGHGKEVQEGIAWREHVEAIRHASKQGPNITSEEELNELSTSKESRHYEHGESQGEGKVPASTEEGLQTFTPRIVVCNVSMDTKEWQEDQDKANDVD
jgi:hypothetical protein